MKCRALVWRRLMPNTSEEPAPPRHRSREVCTDFSSFYSHARRNCGHFSFQRLQEDGGILLLFFFFFSLKESFQQPGWLSLGWGRWALGTAPAAGAGTGGRGAPGPAGSGAALPHLLATGGGKRWRTGWADRGGGGGGKDTTRSPGAACCFHTSPQIS